MNQIPAVFNRQWIQPGVAAAMAGALLYLSNVLPLPAGVKSLESAHVSYQVY